MDFLLEQPQRKSARRQKKDEEAAAAAAAKKSSAEPTPSVSPTPGTSPSLLSADVDQDECDGGVDGGDDASLYTANAAALTSDMNKWSWERVLCSDPEMLIRQASRQSEPEDESPLAIQHRLLDAEKEKEALKNPTPAMTQIIARIQQREKDRQAMTWQQQLQHLTSVSFQHDN